MRTLKLLVLAPFAVAAFVACGGGNANDNPQVPSVDVDAGSSVDTSMLDAGAAMTAPVDTSAASSAMDASVPSTDMSATVDAAAPDTTPVDAGKPKKGKKTKKST